jgi:hypothetical protein
MTARSTAARYRPDNGPEVFGIPGLEVRWNSVSRTIILATADGRWSVSGDFACELIIALAAVHRQGQLRQFLCQHLRTVAHPWQDRYYRCGKTMCKETV